MDLRLAADGCERFCGAGVGDVAAGLPRGRQVRGVFRRQDVFGGAGLGEPDVGSWAMVAMSGLGPVSLPVRLVFHGEKPDIFLGGQRLERPKTRLFLGDESRRPTSCGKPPAAPNTGDVMRSAFSRRRVTRLPLASPYLPGPRG
jgi:hypothetical protein